MQSSLDRIRIIANTGSKLSVYLSTQPPSSSGSYLIPMMSRTRMAGQLRDIEMVESGAYVGSRVDLRTEKSEVIPVDYADAYSRPLGDGSGVRNQGRSGMPARRLSESILEADGAGISDASVEDDATAIEQPHDELIGGEKFAVPIDFASRELRSRLSTSTLQVVF